MKNSKDTTGNRNRDLPACSAVPQLTAHRMPLAQKAFIRQTAVVPRTTIKEKHCKTTKKEQEIRTTKKELIIVPILCPYLT